VIMVISFYMSLESYYKEHFASAKQNKDE